MKRLIGIYLALMLLLALTLFTHQFQLGNSGIAIGLLIAAVKTTLVGWFFMSLNKSSQLTRLAAGAGLLWIFFFYFLGSLDLLFRNWPP